MHWNNGHKCFDKCTEIEQHINLEGTGESALFQETQFSNINNGNKSRNNNIMCSCFMYLNTCT